MKRLALLLVIAASALLAQAPAAKLFPACFSPNTLAIMRIDATQVMDQPLFQEFLASKAGNGVPFFEQIQNGTGVDLETIREVWIAPQQGKDRVLIVAKGTFDAQLIEGRVQAIETMQVVQRPGVPLAVILGNNNPAKTNLAAVLDKETLVFGKPELVDGFLAAFLGKGKGLPPAFAVRASAMLKSKALFAGLLLQLPPKQIKKAPWMALFTHAEGQAFLDDQNVALDVTLGLKKPEMREPATKVLEGVRDLYPLLGENMQKLPQLASMLLEGATIAPDPKNLVIELVLPKEMIEHFLGQKMGLQ